MAASGSRRGLFEMAYSAELSRQKKKTRYDK
jgi:hypothetical protein